MQRRFRLTGNGRLFDNPLIVKVFGTLREKEKGD